MSRKTGALAMSNFFFDSFWPGAVAWSVLYVSDYVLTLTCARLYQMGAKEKIVFEGSYELTPFFQKDINSLRKISHRSWQCLSLAFLGWHWFGGRSAYLKMSSTSWRLAT